MTASLEGWSPSQAADRHVVVDAVARPAGLFRWRLDPAAGTVTRERLVGRDGGHRRSAGGRAAEPPRVRGDERGRRGPALPLRLATDRRCVWARNGSRIPALLLNCSN